MSDKAESVAEAVRRLSRRDPTLKAISLVGNLFIKSTDVELASLVDCLLARPNLITTLELTNNQLTDQIGVRLARYLAASSTLHTLRLASNRFSEKTYLAVAAALRVNKSLRELSLNDNEAVDRARVDLAFVDALRLNPDRPAGSVWRLYLFNWSQDIDFKRLGPLAEAAGPMPHAPTGADERVRQLEQQLRERDQAAAAMQAQIRDVQASLEATQWQLHTSQIQLESSRTQCDRLEASEQTAQVALADARAAARAQVEQVHKELEASHARCSQLEASERASQVALAEVRTAAQTRIEQMQEQFQTSLTQLQDQLRTSQARCDLLELNGQTVAEERQARAAAQAQVDQLQEQLFSSQTRCAQLEASEQAALAEERRARTGSQARIEQVQEQCIRLQQQLLGTQAQLVDLTNAARQHSHGAASSSRADGAAQLGHSTQAVGHRWSELRGGLKTAFELQAAMSALDGYALEQRLGSGSNGAVFTVRVLNEQLLRLWQQSVNGPFTAALKMQLPSHARTSIANQMFAREYAALQALPLHENICTLYWQFVAEPTDQLINDSFPELDPDSRQAIFFAQNAFTGQLTKRRTQFLVMERYATTLDSYVRERNRELTALDRARLALNVAEGLAHMLAHGWLHLDIKPDNLLLASDGRLVITDFGTSMRMHTGTTTLQFSLPLGLIGGNEAHLSPEAIIGRSNEQPFEAAKQPSWELGCVLWYLITGDEHPYPGYPHGYGADFALLPLLDVRQLCTAIEQANTGPSRLAASAVYTLAALSIALLAGSAQQRPAIADAAAVLRTLPVQ